MLFAIGSTIVMGGLAGFSFLKTYSPINDADKIKRIFINSGLQIAENGKKRTIRLYKKRNIKGGKEYVYQLPLGLSTKKIEEHKHVIQDGLNVKTTFSFLAGLLELKKLKVNKKIFEQIRDIFIKVQKAMKEIEIDFDGMLKIRVYDEGLPKSVDWTEDLIKGGWKIPIGYTRTEVIYHDFKEQPHLLVGGSTGTGKSQFLKMMITHLILSQPENLKLSLIDLKEGTSFARFKDLKQVKNFGKNPDEALIVLQLIQQEMNEKYRVIVNGGHEDIDEAGIKEHHILVIDEAADIADDEDCMNIVKDLARRGRAAGIHMVYATQYPTSETVPMQTKRNMTARLSFLIDDETASRVILGRTGAESLPEIKGRALYKTIKMQEVQVPYIDNPTIKDKIEPHINIRQRKEDDGESKPFKEATKDGGYTIVPR